MLLPEAEVDGPGPRGVAQEPLGLGAHGQGGPPSGGRDVGDGRDLLHQGLVGGLGPGEFEAGPLVLLQAPANEEVDEEGAAADEGRALHGLSQGEG